MKRILLFSGFSVGGAIGYLACCVIAAMEEFPFFAIRRLITGKPTMSQIILEPADGWIIPSVTALLVLAGGLTGNLVVQRLRKDSGDASRCRQTR
jgi:hypothetical protein